MSRYKPYSITEILIDDLLRRSANPPKDVPVEGDGGTCRIEWQSRITGFEGHGSMLERNEAINTARTLEGKWPEIKHKVNCKISPTS